MRSSGGRTKRDTALDRLPRPMCGIAGIFQPGFQTGSRHGYNRIAVQQMIQRLRHRGPDGESYFEDREIAMGHCRLAIIDPSDRSRQPMTSHDGRWTIAFNGEIFNYLELRKDVAATGSRFRTQSDTEVLLEACAAWGIPKALDRIRGMFAIALWDGERRELTLARDRFGEKPLFFCHSGRFFAFASELKTLCSFHSRRLDPEAVDAYLTLGFVPAPLSIFRTCRKVTPGHLLRIRAGSLEEERWWSPLPRLDVRREVIQMKPSTPARRAAALRTQIGEAVRIRLRTELPLTLALSGGLDSSVIAAECVRQGASPEAFAVRFDGDSRDLPYASQVAAHFGLRLNVVECTAWGLRTELEAVHGQYDEPFADSSAVSCFALARAAGTAYRVMLNGDGGDELFAGYSHHRHVRWKQAFKRAAATMGWVDGRGCNAAGLYVQSKALFRAAERRQLLERSGSPPACETAEPAWMRPVRLPDPGRSALRSALWIDLQLYLANGLTCKTDIALGAFQMEGRAPLLDHTLFEWTRCLPESDLLRGRSGKLLLRQAYGNDLPVEVLSRSKQGFGAPVEAWLSGPLREAAGDLVPCHLLNCPGQDRARGQKLWALLAFSLWARQTGAGW